jgi:hypothetical protein
MTALWKRQPQQDGTVTRVRALAHDVKADDRCMLLLESYKETAVRSLQGLENANLKGLLRRVVGKIFNDLEIKGWCREFEVRNGVREEEAGEIAKEEPAVAVGG